MPTTTFSAMSEPMVESGACPARNTGIISSDVERITAMSVPTLTTPPAKSVAAMAEKPH